MQTKQLNFRIAKLRAKARKFKASIPIGMAIPLPDSLIDSLADEDVEDFFKQLDYFGLERHRDHPNHWQRKC